MLVFIDESGDPGFKLAKGSSAVFVVALVAFSDYKVAVDAREAIHSLARRCGVNPEFKFSKSRPDVRDVFFECISHFDFRIRAIVAQKSRIYSNHLRANKESFYSFFVKSMLKFDNGLLQGAKVVIDSSGERVFRQELGAYLRRHTEKGAIQSVRFSDSRADRLLQLADMCTGAIARSYSLDRKDAFRWRAMIAQEIDDVWEFK